VYTLIQRSTTLSQRVAQPLRGTAQEAYSRVWEDPSSQLWVPLGYISGDLSLVSSNASFDPRGYCTGRPAMCFELRVGQPSAHWLELCACWCWRPGFALTDLKPRLQRLLSSFSTAYGLNLFEKPECHGSPAHDLSNFDGESLQTSQQAFRVVRRSG